MTPLLLDDGARRAVVDALREVTHGRALVANLEGVILEEPVAGLRADAHLMLRDLAIPMLRDMGVVALSTANNHSRDLGVVGLAETVRILGAEGIVPIEHGKAADVGAARIVALNAVAGHQAAPGVAGQPR